MATNPNRTKAATLSLTEQLLAGLAKHATSMPQVLLLGSTYTAADLAAKLGQLVSAQQALDAARAATRQKAAAQRATTTAVAPIRGALVAYLKAAYGGQTTILSDFGIHMKERTPLTVEQKAAAAAKRQSTRAARGTKGPKQTKAVKGNVTGVTVTPIVASKAVAAGAAGGTTGTTLAPGIPPHPGS